MTNIDRPKSSEEGKLRRWVANLQLESWQLELLITGFSIFLLASGIGEYNDFNRNIQETKLNPGANGINPLISLSINFVLNTIPIGIKFFLINLLIHLLLRGFWIGIVGLSSVSNKIDYEKMKLQGKFRRFIPENVRSLDELILFLDKVSSVVFAYTFLLVFSIISVVIVLALGMSMLGIVVSLSTAREITPFMGILNFLVIIVILAYFVSAIIFFLDTLLFSAFKKSKWFTVLYYPIYRFFSFISLSFLYRSIYYHLITNYKKKQIVGVSVVLVVVLILSMNASSFGINKYYPEATNRTEAFMQESFYDDLRPQERFVQLVSLPSKYVDNGFLEIFLRYNPKDNGILDLICPEARNLNKGVTISKGMKAGMESQMDSTIDVDDILDSKEYEMNVASSLECQTQMFEIWIDGQKYTELDYAFKTHTPNHEAGYLTVIDVKNLARGRHVLEIRKLSVPTSAVFRSYTQEDIKMKLAAKLTFWLE